VVLIAAPKSWIISSTTTGHPKYQRPVEARFWMLISPGLFAEEAAEQIGVAPAVTAWWFRNAGGMSPFNLHYQSSGGTVRILV